MSTEWKTGDVAMVECESWAPGPQRAVRYESGWTWLNDTDYFTNDGIDTPLHRPVRVLRRLVVIDPESIEDVARLNMLIAAIEMSPGTTALAAALREFAKPKPPKPDEPKGLGAVVETELGDKWVRSHVLIEGRPWTRPDLSGTYAWDYFHAVRVLSEGVTE